MLPTPSSGFRSQRRSLPARNIPLIVSNYCPYCHSTPERWTRHYGPLAIPILLLPNFINLSSIFPYSPITVLSSHPSLPISILSRSFFSSATQNHPPPFGNPILNVVNSWGYTRSTATEDHLFSRQLLFARYFILFWLHLNKCDTAFSILMTLSSN